jgi:ribosome-binding protein aMBF1 (putative translation factor)
MPTPAGPGTSQYRCEMCGRHFNTPGELEAHQKDCGEAYRSGRPDKEKKQPKAAPPDPDRDWVSTP